MTASRALIVALATVALCGRFLSAQAPAVGQSIPVNGFEMYYETHGTGEALLLLHGLTQSRVTWAPAISAMRDEYRVIVPDLRGHGRSTNPSKAFTTRQAALDVFSLLDELGIQEFKAIGISAGAATLLHMATSQPERVEAMVLIGAANYLPEQARAVARNADPANMTEERWTVMRQRHHHGDEQILLLQSHFHDLKDGSDDLNFTKPLLSTITARTLIIHGDRDDLLPVAIANEIYEAVPKSYLWVVPNGGHYPIFGEALGPFLKTTGQFLRGQWEQE